MAQNTLNEQLRVDKNFGRLAVERIAFYTYTQTPKPNNSESIKILNDSKNA